MKSGNFQITGNELQEMVTANLLGLKAGQSIPATNRCLTRQEVANRVHVYTGDSPDGGSFIPNSSWQIGNTLYTGPSPNFTCNYNYLNATRLSDSGGNSSLIFEMSQETNPYQNVDLFGFVNGSALRLDPANNLDGMFFGNPQYSPQMSAAVRVGNSVYVQANFGLINPDGPSYGWDAPGFGFLEVSANGTLISNQQIFKPFNNTSSTLQSLSYTFTVQANTNYYVKAYSLVAYPNFQCYSSVSASEACTLAATGTGDCVCCYSGGEGTC
jgi:hypothetical protein